MKHTNLPTALVEALAGLKVNHPVYKHTPSHYHNQALNDAQNIIKQLLESKN